MTPSDSFDIDDVNFGKFYKAATFTSKKVLGEVFALLFHRCTVSVMEDWPDTVASFCVNVLGWSNTKYRNCFNADERTKLEEPFTVLSFDVSLLSKLIYKLFMDLVNLPDPLLKSIRELKNVRNRVCHEQFSMNESNLAKDMDDLKMLICTLVDNTGELFSIDTADMKQRYMDEIDLIMKSYVAAEAQTYLDKVEKFREDLVGRFIIHGRKELTANYAKLKTLNPFTWLSDNKFPELLLDKVFTPLHIEEENRTIDISTILTTELLDENTQDTSNILPSVVTLSGVAGCGKTSFCRYILHDWRCRLGTVAQLRSVDMLIFIELRSVKESSLVSYLQKSLLRETCRLFDEKDIINTLQNMNVLYVIDGMDEADVNGRNLVDEVFSVLGSARMVITTRPEFSSHITHQALTHRHACMKLHIRGFTAQGIKSFTNKVLKNCEPDPNKYKQMKNEFAGYLESTGSALGDHLQLPLTLALLILLWKDNKTYASKIKTSSGLYKEIFKLCSIKLITRIRSTTHHHIELEAIISTWLKALSEVAFNMIADNKYILDSQAQIELSSICRTHGIDPIQTLSAFLVCEVNEGLFGAEYSFSFIHKSQMEYLASLHITKYLTEKDAEKNSTTSRTSRVKNILKDIGIEKPDALINQIQSKVWWNTVVFTLGHICHEQVVTHDTIKMLLKIVLRVNKSDVSRLWRIVQESHLHPVVCEAVGDTVRKSFVWIPECKDLSNKQDPTMLLIKHTPFRPRGVKIRVVSSLASTKVAVDGDVECRDIINIAPALHILGQNPDVSVVLRMDQHFYTWGGKETSDEILSSFLPNGSLQSFMGHLGSEGARAFAGVREINVACIRVSELDALEALTNSLSPKQVKLQHLTLRIDLTPGLSLTSVTQIAAPSNLSVVLHGIHDSTIAWAEELLSRLRKTYNEISLFASTLTPTRAKEFLEGLAGKGVRVEGCFSVRSVHGIDDFYYDELCDMLDGKVEWLW